MAPSVQWVRTTVGYVNAGRIISAQIQKTGAYLLHLIDGREAETCHGACSWEADGPHQETVTRYEQRMKAMERDHG